MEVNILKIIQHNVLGLGVHCTSSTVPGDHVWATWHDLRQGQRCGDDVLRASWPDVPLGAHGDLQHRGGRTGRREHQRDEPLNSAPLVTVNLLNFVAINGIIGPDMIEEKPRHFNTKVICFYWYTLLVKK